MFDIDRFVADCRAALAERSSEAIRDVVRRAVAEPEDPRSPGRTERRQRRRGVPGRGPHDPECRLGRPPMDPAAQPQYRAIIGMYGGGEDNIFWRRLTEDAKGRVEAAGAKSLRLGDVAVLGRDIIHSVSDPLGKLSMALHVYDGDFMADPRRSHWDAEELTECAYDAALVSPMFRQDLVGLG